MPASQAIQISPFQIQVTDQDSKVQIDGIVSVRQVCQGSSSTEFLAYPIDVALNYKVDLNLDQLLSLPACHVTDYFTACAFTIQGPITEIERYNHLPGRVITKMPWTHGSTLIVFIGSHATLPYQLKGLPVISTPYSAPISEGIVEVNLRSDQCTNVSGSSYTLPHFNMTMIDQESNSFFEIQGIFTVEGHCERTTKVVFPPVKAVLQYRFSIDRLRLPVCVHDRWYQFCLLDFSYESLNDSFYMNEHHIGYIPYRLPYNETTTIGAFVGLSPVLTGGSTHSAAYDYQKMKRTNN
jgi:hypothetical protein